MTVDRDLNHLEYMRLKLADRLKHLVWLHNRQTSEESRFYIQGRMYEVTIGMEEHPKDFEFECGCDTCLSYGEPE